MQKQCINFINSNIYIKYWPPGTAFLEETVIQAKERTGVEESVGNKHNKYYKLRNTLHFFDFMSSAFSNFWRIRF